MYASYHRSTHALFMIIFLGKRQTHFHSIRRKQRIYTVLAKKAEGKKNTHTTPPPKGHCSPGSSVIFMILTCCPFCHCTTRGPMHFYILHNAVAYRIAFLLTSFYACIIGRPEPIVLVLISISWGDLNVRFSLRTEIHLKFVCYLFSHELQTWLAVYARIPRACVGKKRWRECWNLSKWEAK